MNINWYSIVITKEDRNRCLGFVTNLETIDDIQYGYFISPYYERCDWGYQQLHFSPDMLFIPLSENDIANFIPFDIQYYK